MMSEERLEQLRQKYAVLLSGNEDWQEVLAEIEHLRDRLREADELEQKNRRLEEEVQTCLRYLGGAMRSLAFGRSGRLECSHPPEAVTPPAEGGGLICQRCGQRWRDQVDLASVMLGTGCSPPPGVSG